MTDAERETRIRVTFGQLEAFEDAHHLLTHAALPEDMDPAIRQAEVDATGALAAELREELTELARGRYVCSTRHPWVPGTIGPVIHPGALDDGECGDGCCDRFRCPRCGAQWRVEHGA